MPNYNDAQAVADLLSQFDFNIINEGPGDFSTQHRKYTCEFSKPGIESFTTTYQYGGTIDFDDNNMDIEDFATKAETAIQDAMDAPLYDALGSNDEILEDGELSGDFEAIKESGYDFPNPCAMSVEAVRTVNEKGYEAAFNEFWREFMPEKGDDAPTLSETAKETRDASGKLEQEGHDDQMSEREDERGNGDTEH